MREIETLVFVKNKFIRDRDSLEKESKWGLVSAIKFYQMKIKQTQKREDAFIKQFMKAKTELLRRELYKRIQLAEKGTTRILEDQESLEEIYIKGQLKNHNT